MTTAPVTTRTRHHTASAVVIDPARRLVLLIDHRATGARQFPGGHVDPDETGDQAALREVAEETGVTAALWTAPADRAVIPGGRRHPTPLMIVEFPAPAKPARGEPAHHHIDLLYLATADATAPVVARLAEVASAVWMPLDGLDTATGTSGRTGAARAAWDLLAADLEFPASL